MAIGLATLVTDVWIRQQWLVPQTEAFITVSIWQAMWAALYLGLVLTWIYYAFMRPARFSRKNSIRYGTAIFRAILKGSQNELPIIADELRHSAKSLVRLSKRNVPNFSRNDGDARIGGMRGLRLAIINKLFRGSGHAPESIAYEVLLMIGDRRFCKYMVSSAPGTIISLFSEVTRRGAVGLPLGQFARNIATEAILNKDSPIYHEGEGLESGYFGYAKPFSVAVFGNWELVEALGDQMGSPLDINFTSYRQWDSENFSAYARLVLMSFESYLRSRRSLQHPCPAINRGVNVIEAIGREIYMHDVRGADVKATDIRAKFAVAIEFVKDMIDILEKEQGVELGPRRVSGVNRHQGNFSDRLARTIYELLCSVSTVKGGTDFGVWHLQHNIGWDGIFGHGEESTVRDVIRFKVRRLLYDEVQRLEDTPNYKSASLLGLCLNVTGLSSNRTGIDRHYRALKVAVLRWAKRHYLRLREVQADVADACLVGGLSFDSEGQQLVKTYSKGLSLEEPREFLKLDSSAAGRSQDAQTTRPVDE